MWLQIVSRGNPLTYGVDVSSWVEAWRLQVVLLGILTTSLV